MRSVEFYKGKLFIAVGLGTFFLPLVEKKNFWLGLLMALFLFITVLVLALKKYRGIFLIIILCTFLQIQWGVGQFIYQEDFSLTTLGETRLHKEEAGVAKFGNDKILRAYGPYKHANSFAGVIVITLIILLRWNKTQKYLYIKNAMVSLATLGLLVTFSRSALISLFILSAIIIASRKLRPQFRSSLCFMLVALFLFAPFWINRFGDVEDKGVEDRVSGYGWSVEIIKENGLWRGTGIASYKSELRQHLKNSGVLFETWQIDYVHSVPLLIAASIGIIPALGLAFIVLLLLRRRAALRLLLLLPILPLLAFDHYLVTQAAPLFYLLLLTTV